MSARTYIRTIRNRTTRKALERFLDEVSNEEFGRLGTFEQSVLVSYYDDGITPQNIALNQGRLQDDVLKVILQDQKNLLDRIRRRFNYLAREVNATILNI